MRYVWQQFARSCGIVASFLYGALAHNALACRSNRRASVTAPAQGASQSLYRSLVIVLWWCSSARSPVGASLRAPSWVAERTGIPCQRPSPVARASHRGPWAKTLKHRVLEVRCLAESDTFGAMVLRRPGKVARGTQVQGVGNCAGDGLLPVGFTF